MKHLFLAGIVCAASLADMDRPRPTTEVLARVTCVPLSEVRSPSPVPFPRLEPARPASGPPTVAVSMESLRATYEATIRDLNAALSAAHADLTACREQRNNPPFRFELRIVKDLRENVVVSTAHFVIARPGGSIGAVSLPANHFERSSRVRRSEDRSTLVGDTVSVEMESAFPDAQHRVTWTLVVKVDATQTARVSARCQLPPGASWGSALSRVEEVR